MATIYLCIGTMKTGTTALQSFMRNNPGPLKNQGFCYPFMDVDVNNRNGHFLIYQSQQNDPQKKEQENIQVRQAGFAKLQGLSKKYQNIVLSEELIWHHFEKHKDFWPNLVEDLKKIDCQLKVIVYLRRQDQLIQSLWNQGVKNGMRIARTFEDYIRQERYSYFPLDYHSQLKKIEKDIGKENLYIRVYEKGQYEGEAHTIVSDLMHVLGLEMTDDLSQGDATKNPSLSGNFIEMKRIINGLPEYRKTPNFAEKPMLSANGYRLKHSEVPKHSLFSFEDQLKFLERYEESNRKVAQEFLGRADGILFRDPVKEQPIYEVDPDTIYEDILTFMTEMFCLQEKRIAQLEAAIEKKSASLFITLAKKLRNLLRTHLQ